jgi:hypothetical protein
MADQYDDTDTITMFPLGPEKRKTEKHPTSTGPAKIKCRHCGAINELEASGWLNTAKSGLKYLRIKVKEKYNAGPTSPVGKSDDIPW